MQSSRDSSVWRTLAVAFGGGLAGLTLTRGAARLAARRPANHELLPLTERIGEIERRISEPRVAQARAAGILPAPFNHNAADAVLAAIEGRFTEIGGQIERRLAELEVKVKIELNALETQDHSLAVGVETRIEELRGEMNAAAAVLAAIEGRFTEIGGQIDRRLAELEVKVKTGLLTLETQKNSLSEGVETRIAELNGEINAAVAAQRQSIDADMRRLHAQMTTTHRELAASLARLVDEQINTTVDARLQAMRQQLRETVREEIRLSGNTEQIAELSGRVEKQERSVMDLVRALGTICLQAAGRLVPERPAPPEPPAIAGGGAGGTSSPSEIRVDPAGDLELPGFARTRPAKPTWHVPIVSSFLCATAGLLLLHYL